MSVRRYVLASIAAAALWLVAASLPPVDAAQGTTLYVRRSVVTNIQQGGTLWAPVDELLKAMGFSWSGDQTFTLTPGTAAGPEIRLRSFTLVLGDRSVQPQTLWRGNHIWVPVKQVAEGLGGAYIESTSAGMVQVVFPSASFSQADIDRAVKEAAKRPPIEVKPSVAPSAGGSPAAETSPAPDASASPDEIDKINAKRKDPVKSNVEVVNNAIPGSRVPAEVRGSASVENIADLPLKNVQVTVIMQDQTGAEVAQGRLPTSYIGELGAGDKRSVDVFWYNTYNLTNLVPKVEVKFDPLPEKEKPKPSPAASPAPSAAPAPSASPGAPPAPSPAPQGTQK